MNHYLNDTYSYIGPTDYNYQQIDYTDGDLAIINHLTYTPHMHSTQSNKVFIAICHQGQLTFDMDGTEFVLGRNQVFIGHPNAIYDHFQMSRDLECQLFCLSESLLLEMLYPNQGIWNRTLYLKKHHYIHLTEQEAALQDHMNVLLMYNLERKDQIFCKEIIHSLVQSMVYELCRSLAQNSQEESSKETNQRIILFDHFISILSKSEVKKHPLSYYSDQLNVTSRYLTMVCRVVSGKTAYEWICEYVENDVRYHLLHTNMSIKEIATKLGFCNLSFFGKYVRENFGQSPSDFRKQSQ